MLDLLVVGLGGAAGANCRFLITGLVTRRLGALFPWATLLINFSGSLLLGLLLALAGRAIMAEPFYGWLLAAGFCGGYTTFSTYTYETLALARQPFRRRAALGYWLGSYLLGLGGAALGLALGNL